MRVGRLNIFGIGADIADMGEGEIDDLPGIAGVRHHFLIARHGRVEADFTDGRALSAKAPAPDNLTRLQNQNACRSAGRARAGGVGHEGRSFK